MNNYARQLKREQESRKMRQKWRKTVETVKWLAFPALIIFFALVVGYVENTPL